MYKLMSGDKLIGSLQNAVFIRKITETNTNVRCSKGEADAIVAGGVVYAITNSADYKDCERVAIFELDSEIERTAELDYIRVMENLI